MSDLYPASRNQAAETLYWFDLAKRVLSGEVAPEEACNILKLDALYAEASESDGERLRPIAARQ